MTGMTIRMTALSQRYHNNILLTKFKESVSQNCYRNPIATKASCESNKHLSSAHLI